MPTAADIPFSRGLHAVGAETWAYLQPDGVMGLSNAGLVAGRDASLLVDTLFDLHLTEAMLGAMAPVVGGRPILTVVNTHANGDHTFGNQLLPGDASIWASAAAADDFDEYPPAVMAAIQKATPGTLGAFDFDGIELRPPNHTFSGSATLDVGGRTVDVIEVGPAHTRGDVVVHAPDAGVVFAGDVLFIGVAPMMWSGPPSNWIDAIDRICALEPNLIVPGHGPVTDVAGARRAQGYLETLMREAEARHRRGMQVMEAVRDIGGAPFADLLEPERVVNLADKVYADLDPAYVPMAGSELTANMREIASEWSTA